jgi:hypothetical protein
MKKSLLFQSMTLVLFTFLTFQACKEDKTYELDTLVANAIDLNGASSATGVDTKADIVATFSQDIDATSATNTNITLTRDYDNADIPLAVSVSGRVVTINPDEDLGSGTLYKLSFKTGLKYGDGTAVTPLDRTFTTAGNFAPAGVIAHWTFEDNANDVVGNFDPSASVAVTYTASRNAAAGKAATFDGDASIIEIPGADQLMNTNDFSLGFWVKTNSTGHVNADGNPAGHFVMGLGAFKGFQFEIPSDYGWCKLAASYKLADGTGAAEDLWFNGDGKTFANGGWQGWDFAKDLTGSGGVAALLKDKWAHVVCVYNSATKQGILYINGEKMKSFDFDLWPDGDAKRGVSGMKYNGVAPEVVNELAFGFVQSRAGLLWDTEPWGGYDFPTANHFKGQLDDVRIWHKVLTGDEILLLYNSEK